MSSDSDEDSSSSSDMSSPEARPIADELGLDVSDDSASGSQSPQRAASQQDSESEASPKQAQAESDDEDEQPVRRRQVSNDDEDDDQPVRRRQVSNDDEDDEDDNLPLRHRQVLNSDDEEQEIVKQKQKRRTRVASSSSSDASQRHASDEEEQRVKQRQSSAHEEAEGSDEENVITKRRDEEDQRSEKSASEDERRSVGDRDQQDDNEDGQQSAHNEEEDIPETRIEIDLPRIDVDFGTETHFVKLPNFLSVETRPFDEQQFEDEAPQDDVLDEEGRVRLKLKVENTIRWRIVTDEHGNEQRESNARIVRWSDGSLSMHLGDEVFDVHVMPLHDDFNHLFLKQGNGLEGLTVFRTKLTFRPHSTDSHTHKKVTLSMADRTARAAQKVKMIPIVQGNPELAKLQLAKKEDEQARAQLKRENRQRVLRARQRRSGLTQSMLEGDIDEEEGAVSISALKRDARTRKSTLAGPSQRSARFASSDDEDAHSGYSDDDSDVEFGKKRKKRTKMVLDEPDDDDDA